MFGVVAAGGGGVGKVFGVDEEGVGVRDEEVVVEDPGGDVVGDLGAVAEGGGAVAG